ncbi:hypothetical protein C7C46_11430 [Streptomyces tateyamensis]|uniref:Uncharacterized protein n=1 Tax=Streptomyces tateyamensis TaxID=565073 RepID=A0A2V4PCT4_9ACTN|nr:hypothetical protein C7C46_11430 [Streptomyces tateyamensis]
MLGGAAVVATVASTADLGRRGPTRSGAAATAVIGAGRTPLQPAPVAPDAPSEQDPRLLSAGDLPLLVDGTDSWQEDASYSGYGLASDLPCLRRPLDDLGARSQAYRTYRQATHPGGKFVFYYAAELLADFATPAAANEAAARLDTWIGQCAQDNVLPAASVVSRGPGQWSITNNASGPDRNSKLPAGSRAEGEFAVQTKGSTVCILYVGAETAGDLPWDRMKQAAAKAVAKL